MSIHPRTSRRGERRCGERRGEEKRYHRGESRDEERMLEITVRKAESKPNTRIGVRGD